VWKYAPTVGVKLRKNTVSARNVMYVYERLAPGEQGDTRVLMIQH
jgi:hypothetical protein